MLITRKEMYRSISLTNKNAKRRKKKKKGGREALNKMREYIMFTDRKSQC